MRLLAEEGPDAVTLPRIASAGHFTSGPLYRRYDTGPDVVLDLWNTELRGFFSRVVEASVRWMSEPDTTDTAWLTESLHTPSTETKALIGVFAVARRLGAQGEEVRSETTSILDAFVNSETSLPPAIAIAHVVPLIGAWLMQPISGSMSSSVAAQRFAFATEYRNPEHWTATASGIPYTPPSLPSLSTGDATLDDLRAATLRVVSRHGCAGATSNRITREAGRSITSAYRRLGNKEQLVADAIGNALSVDFGFSGQVGAASMPFARADRLPRMVNVLRNQLHPANYVNRAFLLESLLGARHDHTIKENVRRWVDTASGHFRSSTSQLGVDHETTETILSRWSFRIASGLGALVLSMVAPTLFERIDPMPVTSATDAVGLPVGKR